MGLDSVVERGTHKGSGAQCDGVIFAMLITNSAGERNMTSQPIALSFSINSLVWRGWMHVVNAHI